MAPSITLAIEVPAGMGNIIIDSACGDIIVEYGDERRTYSRSGKIRHGNGGNVIVANTVSEDIKIAG